MIRRNFLRALLVIAAATLAVAPATARAQLKVVTTSTDLNDIARAVGGSRVASLAIEQGYQDPHFVEAKPSFILKLRDADVLALVGLDLEIGWLPLLVDGARNAKIRQGGSGYMDMSKVVPVLDVPSGNVDRSQGDVHPLGNPHYWLDPENGKRIAHAFKVKFSQLDPKGEDFYEKNEKAFDARVDATVKSLAGDLAAIKGKQVVAYHTSWRYFAEFNGMAIQAFMEPKPGVPPSPSHLAGVVLQMRRTGTRAIVQEPFYERKSADWLASRASAKVVILPTSVGGIKGVDDYVSLIAYDVKTLAAALR